METWILGAISTIALGLAGWSLKSIVDIKILQAAMEERINGNRNEIQAVEKRAIESIAKVERQQTEEYGDLRAEMRTSFDKLDGKVTKIHERIDSIN